MGVYTEFTFPELKQFLFRRKMCPVCETQLKRRSSYNLHKGREFHMEDEYGPLFQPDSDVKCYSFVYKCPTCGREFSLKELNKLSKKNK